MSNRPVARSISSDTLPFSLSLRSLSLSPRTSLRRDRQHAFEAEIGEDPAGDVADPGDRPRLQPQRHAHRPGRQLARAPRRGRRRSRSCRTRPAGWSADRHNRRVANGPSSVHTMPHVAAGHVGEQRRRAQQVDARGCTLSIAARAPRSTAPRATARSDGEASVSSPSSMRSSKRRRRRSRGSRGAVSRCSLPLRNGAGASVPDSR